MGETQWEIWSRRLVSIAQAGLAYSKNDFDLERFREIKKIAAEMVSAGTGEPIERVQGLFDKETGYQTPKIDVRGAVFSDGNILLVPENLDSGKWTLPGGWGEPWDTPRKNIERELLEETGLEVQAVKLAAVYDRKSHAHTPEIYNSYKLFFICELLSGEPKASNETGEPKYFSEVEVPEDVSLSVRRVRRHQILRMFEHYRDPELPTDFD